jgi:hypothetical protein
MTQIQDTAAKRMWQKCFSDLIDISLDSSDGYGQVLSRDYLSKLSIIIWNMCVYMAENGFDETNFSERAILEKSLEIGQENRIDVTLITKLEIAVSKNTDTDLWGVGFIISRGQGAFYGSCKTIQRESIRFIKDILLENQNLLISDFFIGISSLNNDTVCAINNTSPLILQELINIVNTLSINAEITNQIGHSTYDLAALASFQQCQIGEHTLGHTNEYLANKKLCCFCKHSSMLSTPCSYTCELILKSNMKKLLFSKSNTSPQENAILARVDSQKLPTCFCEQFEKY